MLPLAYKNKNECDVESFQTGFSTVDRKALKGAPLEFILRYLEY